MVSGKIFPLVSGKIRDSSPAITDKPPKIISGRAVPKSPSTSFP